MGAMMSCQLITLCTHSKCGCCTICCYTGCTHSYVYNERHQKKLAQYNFALYFLQVFNHHPPSAHRFLNSPFHLLSSIFLHLPNFYLSSIHFSVFSYPNMSTSPPLSFPKQRHPSLPLLSLSTRKPPRFAPLPSRFITR